MKVIILSGIPGSGKSTWIEKNYPEAEVVSADFWFMHDEEYKFNPAEIGQAHANCLLNFIELMDSTFDVGILEDIYSPEVVIVDNTNTTAVEIAPYYAIAKAYDCEVELVTFFISAEEGFARNKHGVSLEVCQALEKQLIERELPPYWEMTQTQI